MRHVGLLLGVMVMLASVVVALVSPSFAQTNGLSVRVGDRGEDLDACPSTGRVFNLNPNGDNFLAVRSGPGSQYPLIDRVHTGYILSLCERLADWEGVVYHPTGEWVDCGVNSPLPLQDYSGPCRSGWVFGDYVEGIAG